MFSVLLPKKEKTKALFSTVFDMLLEPKNVQNSIFRIPAKPAEKDSTCLDLL